MVLEDAFQGVVRYERSTERTRPPQLPMQRCVSAADDGWESSARRPSELLQPSQHSTRSACTVTDHFITNIARVAFMYS